MISRRSLPTSLVVALVVVLSACADFKDMLTLQQGLVREFQTSAISVNISNSTALTVVFSNSQVADLPESERAAFARRVAEYVRDHYAHYDQLQAVYVGFASVKGAAGFSVSSTQIPYHFSPADLGAPVGPKKQLPAKAA